MVKRAVLIASLGLLGVVGWLLSRGADPPETTAMPVIGEPAATEVVGIPIASPESVDQRSGRTPYLAPLDSDPVPRVSIVVSTRKTLRDGTTPMPHVSVVVGVGGSSEFDFPALAEITTDERGQGEVTIPWKAVEEARVKPGGRLWARVVSEGFQESTYRVPLPLAPNPTEFPVLVVSGMTVRGRLLDADDHGVAGRIHTVKPQTSTRWSMGHAEAWADGSFFLHLTAPGSFDVLAEAGEAGTAAILGKAFSPATASEPLVLHVRGPGIVRGHVRDSSGKPASGLSLLVYLALLDDERGSFVGREPEESQVAREGRGRSWATMSTAADGTFEARGMRADRYVVRARTRSDGTYPYLLTPTPIESDGRDLALVLERPHIAVRVVDDQGATVARPATMPEDSWGGELSTLDPPESWLTRWVVLAVPVASEAHLGPLWRPYLQPKLSGEEIVFEVAEGQRYQVGLIGGSQVWRPKEVLIDPGATRVEVTLTASASAPMGEISVSAFDSERAAVFSNVSIQIEDPATGTPLVRRDFFYDKPWPQRFQVPQGVYRVIVEGAPSTDLFHGTLMFPRGLGRHESLVHVSSGQESVVSAELPRGAKLHLTLAGEVLEEDREAIRRRSAGMHYELEYWANRAELTLVPPEGWPQPAMFTMELTGSSAAGTHLTSELALGSDSTSQILSAGRFRLEARMPGGRVASKEIVLIDGATTDVTLDLGP